MEKVLKNIMIVVAIFLICIISVCAILLIRKNKVISEFESLMSELKRNGNYRFSYSLIDETKEKKYEEISKNGITKVVELEENYSGNVIKDKVSYFIGKRHIIVNNLEKQIFQSKENSYYVKLVNTPLDTLNSYFLRNSSEIKVKSFKVENFNNKKCYSLNVGIVTEVQDVYEIIEWEEKIYIDYETHEIIGLKKDDELYVCKIEVNTVKDSDIKIPDVSDFVGYEIKEY